MGSSSLEEENITKDVRNLFRLKKEIDDTTTEDIRNPCEHEGETNYYKPVIVSTFLSNIEYESKGNRNKT